MTTQYSGAKLKAYLQIHIAVFLFGFTAILGDQILLPESAIVWWRMGMTGLSLLILPGIVKAVRVIGRKDLVALMGIGFLISLHWAFFFGAIKYSNVSITLSVLASTTFFTSILEPMLTKRKFRWYELGLGLIVVPGVYLIYQSADFFYLGIIFALISALLAAIFSILNKKMVAKHDPRAITFIELTSGWIAFTPLLMLYYLYAPEENFIPSQLDWFYLSILAFLCTSVAFVISLKALKVLPTFSVNLTINLEPVYGILLAWVLLAEHKELSSGFYAGAGVIMLAVFLHPVMEKYFNK